MWWQRSSKEGAVWSNQLSDCVKAFGGGTLQCCRNSQRQPCLLQNSNKGEASKAATQRLKQSVSYWENYLVRRVWRRRVYVSFDIKERPSILLSPDFSFWSSHSPQKNYLLWMHSMHFWKMKSSETYINRQAPPKVAFVPKWSDFSLGCQFMLHVTHVPKAPPLPHMVPKTGTRKQTVPPHCGLLTLSQAISSWVTWQARHQHYCDETVTHRITE